MKRYLLALILVALLLVSYNHVTLAAPPEQGGGITHYVRTGETLESIAAQYGVNVEAIMQYNGIFNPDLIYAGQPLIIPGGGYGPPSSYPPNIGYGCANSHTVQFGETLSGIAWHYGVSVEQLLRLNNLFNADFVYIGQRLCIPAPYVPQPASYGPIPVYQPQPPPPIWYKPVPPKPISPCGCGTPDCVCPPIFHPKPEPPCGCDNPNCGGCPPPPPSSCGCNAPDCRCPPPHKPDPCSCDDDDDCKLRPPCVEVRHLTQEYEQWHRPKNGLAACVNEKGPYDVMAPPVTRFTIGVWLINNSPFAIPGSWANSANVIIETKSGQWRQACVWDPGTTPSAQAKGGKSIVVTFFTHLDQGDYVKDIHFYGLPGAPCFDPGNETVKPCNPFGPPIGISPDIAIPGYPPGTTSTKTDTAFSSHS